MEIRFTPEQLKAIEGLGGAAWVRVVTLEAAAEECLRRADLSAKTVPAAQLREMDREAQDLRIQAAAARAELGGL